MNIDIRHIAKLARLEITDGELSQFETEMQSIVNMVEDLPDISDELKPDENTPMVLREDVSEDNKFTRDELMKNAPSVKAGCLVVPKTVE